MKCKDCKKCSKLNDGHGICTNCNSWFPIEIENDCVFEIKPKKKLCGDCVNQWEDAGCTGCQDTDTYAETCCNNFYPKAERDIVEAIEYYISIGIDPKTEIKKIINNYFKEYDKIMKER